MKQIVLILTALAGLVCLGNGYPTGAPKCSSLVPKHETHRPQTSASPYQVTTSAVSKKNGKSIVAVTVSGTEQFKGFFLYATQPGSSDMIGEFTQTDKTKKLTCGSASAITHADDKKKSSITVTWTAPDNFSGEVEFKATVVKEFEKFWTGMKSPKVTI